MIALIKRLRSGRQPESTFLHNEEVLRVILERERMRCDRNGQTLSVIAIEFKSRAKSRENREIIATVLQRRLRETDAAGIVQDDQFAVVLPDTPLEGARIVADTLRELLAERGLHPKFSLLVYSANDNDDHHHTNGNGNGNGSLPIRDLQKWFVNPMPAWKRTVDIFGACVGLLLLSPLLCFTAVMVKVTSRGPIFYGQQRTGLGGATFQIFKFRSMVVDAEKRQREIMDLNVQDGPALKFNGDPRITWVGRFLRKTSIDELPQLWNVLKGDMSIVGPRPLFTPEARQVEGWQKRRVSVTPGITCIWQAKGRPRESFAEWMRLDLEYVKERSLWNDVKILLRTIPVVMFCRGANG